MRRFRRRHILVDSFQGRLVLVSFIYFGVILITLAATLFLPTMMVLQDDGMTWDQKQQASAQFLTLHHRLWPAILVMFMLLAVHSVIVSHRIAGPLYQFRRIFRSIADGDLSVRAKIRKNDYLTKEMNDINTMIDGLKSRIEACSEANEQAVSALAELRETAASAEVHRLTGHIELQLSKLNAALEFFKTTRESKPETPSAEDGALEEATNTV